MGIQNPFSRKICRVGATDEDEFARRRERGERRED